MERSDSRSLQGRMQVCLRVFRTTTSRCFGYHSGLIRKSEFKVLCMTVLAMADLDLQGKRVLIREDLNVPVKGGKIVNDARIRAALPTLELAHYQAARFLKARIRRVPPAPDWRGETARPGAPVPTRSSPPRR